jgi:hypothetical protein
MPLNSPEWLAADGVAIIVAFFTVVVSPALIILLNGRLNRKVKTINAATAATLYQVKNDHPKNMRVEGDDRHNEILAELGGLAKIVRTIGADVGALKTDHSFLSNLITAQAARLGKLERARARAKPAAAKPKAAA